MFRTALRRVIALVTMLALVTIAAPVAAQDTIPPHPSHIHAGTCEDLDPNPAFPLNNVTPVTDEAPVGAVEVAHSTIDVTLDELLASPYALNVHESDENVATYIACGDVRGPVVDGLLLIPLRQQNNSSYFGIAALASSDGGTTNVSVYFAPDGADGLQDVSTDAEATTREESDEVSETGESEAINEVAIDITDFAFSPQVLEISVGTTVTWTNNDSAQHTATANDGMFDSNVLGQGESFSFRFDQPGTWDYICTLHPSMEGQIVVSEA